MTTAAKALPFVDGFSYGEGPRWRDGRLWFTDGPGGKVFSAGESGDLTVEVELPHASGLGWLPDGTLVVSCLFAPFIHHVDPRGTVIATFDISELAASANDLVVGPDGRGYVNLYGAIASQTAGAIGLIQPDGILRVVANELALPNGMGFLSEGSTLIVSETNGSRILAFPTEADGGLGAPTVFADLGADRHPDGLCVDVDDGVWVGCFDSGEFLRVIEGGTVTHHVAVDSGWAVAPALGGSDRRTLYLVIDETTAEGMVTGGSVGRVMQARVDVPGAGSP